MASRRTRSDEASRGIYGAASAPAADENARVRSSRSSQDDLSRYSRSNYGRSARPDAGSPRTADSAYEAFSRSSSSGAAVYGGVKSTVRSASESSSCSGAPRASHSLSQGEKPLTAGDFRQQYSRDNERYSAKEARKSGRGKKVAIGVLCMLLFALVGCGAAFAHFVNKVDQELSNGKTAEEQEAIATALADRANSTDPFYMLLLGSDARANDASMGARADTSIVVRVDPKTNTATLVSIPRDTMIYIDGSGPYKFNAAYSFRGTAGAIAAASKLLNVPISHYAEVNFENLVDLVDAVGGVEVDVPARINDSDAGDVIIEKGLQTLDGEAALVFARSRAYVDGDFTRTSNQRLLIEALLNKVLSLPIDQMPGVIQEAAKCVTTDLSLTEIIGLATEFIDDDGDLTIYSAMVPSTTSMVDGVSYVVTDESGLKKMMEVVAQGGDPSTVQTYGATGSSLNNS